MKIKELITRLQSFDPELMVVCHGYEGGEHEITKLTIIGLKLNANKAWYYGEHEETYDNEKPDAMAVKIN
jgi:hypothetical protein